MVVSLGTGPETAALPTRSSEESEVDEPEVTCNGRLLV
jgi:hypothetical protein